MHFDSLPVGKYDPASTPRQDEDGDGVHLFLGQISAENQRGREEDAKLLHGVCEDPLRDLGVLVHFFVERIPCLGSARVSNQLIKVKYIFKSA